MYLTDVLSLSTVRQRGVHTPPPAIYYFTLLEAERRERVGAAELWAPLTLARWLREVGLERNFPRAHLVLAPQHVTSRE